MKEVEISLNCSSKDLVIVGDRYLTDVVFGNLHGMLTVHTLPLCSGDENKNDNTVARVIRTVENKAMYGDWWVGRKIRSYTMGHKVWKGEEECPLVLGKKKKKKKAPVLGEVEKD